jgi:hypothetical protein
MESQAGPRERDFQGSQVGEGTRAGQRERDFQQSQVGERETVVGSLHQLEGSQRRLVERRIGREEKLAGL